MTAASAASGGPHDRPSSAELVEAVREFLERDVMDATEGSVKYHTRVAINALAMVERELATGADASERHATRLATLGVSNDAELAAQIRAGALDDRWDDVVDSVRADVLDKLAVANPTYPDDPT
jgi:hypothetical protein